MWWPFRYRPTPAECQALFNRIVDADGFTDISAQENKVLRSPEWRRYCAAEHARKSTQKRADSRADPHSSRLLELLAQTGRIYQIPDYGSLTAVERQYIAPRRWGYRHMTPKTTKLTLEVTPEQHARLHEANPGLITAPAQDDPLDWSANLNPVCAIKDAWFHGSKGAMLEVEDWSQGFYTHELRTLGEALVAAAEALEGGKK